MKQTSQPLKRIQKVKMNYRVIGFITVVHTHSPCTELFLFKSIATFAVILLSEMKSDTSFGGGGKSEDILLQHQEAFSDRIV